MSFSETYIIPEIKKKKRSGSKREPLTNRISGLNDLRTIAIGSGKGGVGKSLIAIQIGYLLAKQNYRVVLLDMDLGSPSLHHLFQVPFPQRTIKELILNPEAEIKDLSHETPVKNLKVVYGSSDTLGLIDNSELLISQVLKKVGQTEADFVIFDLGTGINSYDVNIFLKADHSILIGTPEPAVIVENFNFLKFCILRRLEEIFCNSPTILKYIKAAYFNFDAVVYEKIKKILLSLNRKEKTVLKNDVLNFYPEFILNMVRDDDEHPYALTIELALKEMFSIGLKQFTSIPYFPNMRNFLKTDAIDQIINNMSENDMVFQDIINHLIRKQKSDEALDDVFRIKTKFKTKLSSGTNSLICSSNCRLWNNCEYQRGGYPCRIKYIGFINNN